MNVEDPSRLAYRLQLTSSYHQVQVGSFYIVFQSNRANLAITSSLSPVMQSVCLEMSDFQYHTTLFLDNMYPITFTTAYNSLFFNFLQYQHIS